MTPEKFKILIDGLFGLFSAIIVSFTILKMWQDFNKRVVDVAKEKSTGATALAKAIERITALEIYKVDSEAKRKESDERVRAIDHKVDVQMQNYQNIIQQLMAQFSAFFNK